MILSVCSFSLLWRITVTFLLLSFPLYVLPFHLAFHAASDVNKPRLGQLHAASDVNKPRLGQFHAASDVSKPRLGQLHAASGVNKPRLGQLHATSDVNKPRLGQLHRIICPVLFSVFSDQFTCLMLWIACYYLFLLYINSFQLMKQVYISKHLKSGP